MHDRTKQKLEEDVEVLHKALDDVLSLFVLAQGWDYSCVDAALSALSRNRGKLPITLALAERMDDDARPHKTR